MAWGWEVELGKNKQISNTNKKQNIGLIQVID